MPAPHKSREFRMRELLTTLLAIHDEQYEFEHAAKECKGPSRRAYLTFMADTLRKYKAEYMGELVLMFEELKTPSERGQ